jgi:hypothetical protein
LFFPLCSSVFLWSLSASYHAADLALAAAAADLKRLDAQPTQAELRALA